MFFLVVLKKCATKTNTINTKSNTICNSCLFQIYIFCYFLSLKQSFHFLKIFFWFFHISLIFQSEFFNFRCDAVCKLKRKGRGKKIFLTLELTEIRFLLKILFFSFSPLFSLILFFRESSISVLYVYVNFTKSAKEFKWKFLCWLCQILWQSFVRFCIDDICLF